MNGYEAKVTIDALISTVAVHQDMVSRAQRILTSHLVPDGISEKEAISQLLELLDGPHERAVSDIAKDAHELAQRFKERFD